MKPITAQLTPDMGEHVLEVLRQKTGELPNEGFVAGQAVASAIDEILGKGQPVYNDVDVFLSRNQWEAQTGNMPRYLKRERFSVADSVRYYAEDGELTVDTYDNAMRLAARDLYTVRETRMDDMTNRVLVDWSYSVAQATAAERADSLIRVFDANNVQVAVDLQTHKLHRTAAYDQFLDSRELQLTQAFTPMQSLLRYLKKRQELGVYGNDKAHIDLVRRLLQANEYSTELREQRQEAFKAGRRLFDVEFMRGYIKREPAACKLFPTSRVVLGTGVRHMPLVFGSKYKALYDRFADELSPHFTLTESGKGRLWLLSSTEEEVNAGAAAPILGAWKPSVDQSTGSNVLRRYWQLALAPGKQLSHRRALFEEFLTQVTDVHVRESYAMAHRYKGDAYLEGCDSTAALKELIRVVNEHHEFTWAAVGLAMAQQITLMRKLRKAFKAHGVPDAWGVCLRQTPQSMQAWLEQPELLDARLKALAGTKEPLYPRRLPLPANVDDIAILELDNSFELRKEGTKMRHCVSGYVQPILDEMCRIVSFRKGTSATECATLEWNFVENKELPAFEVLTGDKKIYPLQTVCRQIRSFANGTPLPELTALEVELREQLDSWLKEHPEDGWQMLRPNALAMRRNPSLAARKKTKSRFEARQMQDEFDDDFF